MGVLITCRCGHGFYTKDGPERESRPCPVCGFQSIVPRSKRLWWQQIWSWNIIRWLKSALVARLRGLLFIVGGIGLVVLLAVLMRALGIPPGSMVKVVALPVALFIFAG